MISKALQLWANKTVTEDKNIIQLNPLKVNYGFCQSLQNVKKFL
jgi:hypothetical protein